MAVCRWIVGGLVALLPVGFTNAATMRYPFDRNHSTIGFAAPVLKVSKVTGKFADFQGAVLVPDAKDLTTASVEVTIQAASIDTGIDDRDKHLRSEDFFDVSRCPEITFKSRQVRKLGPGYAVDGLFTMRCVSKELTIPFTLRDLSDVVAAEAHLQLNRKDYGVAWTRVMDDGSLFVDDQIEVDLYLLTRVGAAATEGEVKAPPAKKDDHH